MSLRVNNQDMNRVYQYNNPNNKVNKSKSISFENQFNKLNQNKSTNNINNCCNTSQIQTVGALSYSHTGKINNISKLSNEQQTLIEDQKTYEKFGLRDEGIEFNSEEFKTWKEEHTDNTFPPLDAPWKVRKAFREMEESVADDPVAKDKLESFESYMYTIIHYPDEFGYAKDLDFSDPQSYCTLIDSVVNKYMDFYNLKLEKEYLDFANLAKDVGNNFKKYL